MSIVTLIISLVTKSHDPLSRGSQSNLEVVGLTGFFALWRELKV